jgi:fibronectin type 3 domain-containing protein
MAQHGLNLSWTAPAGADSAVSYNVYRGTVTGGPYAKINTAPVTATTYLDTTGVAGTEYFYVVTDVDSKGFESAYSTEANGVFPASPNAPSGLTITII